jgi:hypothetical protein
VPQAELQVPQETIIMGVKAGRFDDACATLGKTIGALGGP